MAGNGLGRLEKVELREAWASESGDFTPWLAKEENLRLLGETLGLPLQLVKQEKEVGPFRADILCKDLSNDSWVVIENQLELTDHSHLGQILTYAAGLGAATMVWIAQRFTEEHRAALDWLNEHTDDKTYFLGLEVELWRIGDSQPAPKFNMVAKPNDWSREVRASATRGELTQYQRLQLEYWTEYRRFMDDSSMPSAEPQANYWMVHGFGQDSRFYVASVAAKFRNAPNGSGPQLRVEFNVSMNEPREAFGWFQTRRESIEEAMGASLIWDSETYKYQCRAYVAKDGDIRDRDKWAEQHRWLRDNAEKMYSAFRPLVKEYKVTLGENPRDPADWLGDS